MKFLVGYTGSKESKAALALARDFAKIHGAKVVVMTSMEGGKGESLDEIGKVEYELKVPASSSKRPGSPVKPSTSQGDCHREKTSSSSPKTTTSTIFSSASRKYPKLGRCSWDPPLNTLFSKHRVR